MTDEKHICQICKQEFTKRDLFPIELIRSTIADKIPKCENGHPGYICNKDLSHIRADYMKGLLEQEKGDLSKLDEAVIQAEAEHSINTENMNKSFQQKLTFGEKVADKVAHFGGSWKFILIYTLIIGGWITLNTSLVFADVFDPYPFILLNLFLSCLAALQAPIIMMSQNRQANREKMQTDYEYSVNLKAELEIRQLHAKLDQFMKNQWTRILEIQQIQIELAEQILDHDDKPEQS